MAAKHIEIAREDGPKAGFTAWITQMERSGLPQVQERLAEVKAQGNRKAQFEYYCNVYGSKIFGTSAQKPEPVAEVASQDDLFNAFKAFMGRVAGGTQTPAVAEDDSLDDVDESAYGATTSTTRSTRRTRSNANTARAAASTDDPYKPRNPEDLATAGRLWRLNEAGLLRIVNKPVEPLTNGQAHEILKDILA